MGFSSQAVDVVPASRDLCKQRFGDFLFAGETDTFDGGGMGRQWYSLAGVTDDERVARTAGRCRSFRAGASRQERFGV